MTFSLAIDKNATKLESHYFQWNDDEIIIIIIINFPIQIEKQINADNLMGN